MAGSSPLRRTVVYQTLEEFLEDVRVLVSADVLTVGNWSFAQILEHLARAIDASIDGFSFRSHWLVRTLVAPLLKNRLLTSPMKPGFTLPKRASHYLPQAGIDLDNAASHLETAVQRLSTTQPTADHPFLGRLSDREWLALHLRHAEMHMSFVVSRQEDGPVEGSGK